LIGLFDKLRHNDLLAIVQSPFLSVITAFDRDCTRVGCRPRQRDVLKGLMDMKRLKAAALLCSATLACVSGAVSSSLAAGTVPGWPLYLAMGAVGGLWGGGNTTNVIKNFSNTDDHGWLAGKIINYYKHPVNIPGN